MGWDKTPSEFMITVKDDLTKHRRRIAMEVLQGVVMMSPVDTGRFRANNMVTVDAVGTSYSDVTDKSGGPTIQKGGAVIGTVESPFGTITIQNNLSYAEALENGHSGQAPAGIYGVTFESIKAKYAS